jgi:endonuclease/exonuclease/phosphatase (EEP) superfamily protein YafD
MFGTRPCNWPQPFFLDLVVLVVWAYSCIKCKARSSTSQNQALLTQQANASAPTSILQKNPQWYQQLSYVCESAVEANFGLFWSVFLSMQLGEWLGALESICDSIPAELGAIHPSCLRFTAHIANNVTYYGMPEWLCHSSKAPLRCEIL